MLALEATWPGSMSLAAQECNLCKSAPVLSAGLAFIRIPCAMRWNPWAMLAVKMVPDCFGFDILWSDGKSIPQYYLLVGGLLTK